jgi:P-type Mg2+ transporter
MDSFGLTTDRASENLIKYGKNTLHNYRVSALKILFRQFTNPLIYLLVLAAIISVILSTWTDAVAILVILFVNAVLGFIQEYKSEKIVAKLKNLITQTAIVRRDGKEIEIPKENIVPEDVVILKSGKSVPADGIIINSEQLLIDESTFSGESAAVNKTVGDLICAGTTVTGGNCEFRVTQTGTSTELGKIAKLASQTRKKSKYEENVTKMSKLLIRITFAIIFMVFIINLFIKGANTQNFISLLLFTTALAISVVPEALPVITTITLTSGAMKLAKKHVVVKRLTSVEDLGNVEILCTDKTGTITQNELVVKTVNSVFIHNFFHFIAPCLEPDNPIDIAIHKVIPQNIKNDLLKNKIIATLPFNPILRRRWIIMENDNTRFLVVLGSAEEILTLSTDHEKSKLKSEINTIEKSGLRTFAAGYKEIKENFSFKENFDETKLIFLGYLTIHDPIRKTASAAISQATKLGVQVKIITGDSLEVAKYTAAKIGLLKPNDKTYTGSELIHLTENEFSIACKNGIVFSRVSPELKYRIVENLKKHYVVAYQGDGINDAPALKAASVGIAVNNAVDIARESSDIILLDRDLKVIIDGIESGRKIFSNINKYIKHTMISNWANFFAIAIISIFTKVLPLLPVQVILSSIFSDLPQIAVSTDNVDTQDLKKPAHYIIGDLITLPLISGVITAIFSIGLYFLLSGYPLDYRRTFWLLLITVRDLTVIISARKSQWMFRGSIPSKSLSFTILTFMFLVLWLPISPFAQIFHLVPLSINDNIFIVISTIFYLIVLDFVKIIYQHFNNRNLSQKLSDINLANLN